MFPCVPVCLLCGSTLSMRHDIWNMNNTITLGQLTLTKLLAWAYSCCSQGLNINGGGGQTKEIKIRLRPHGSDSSFLPYESLVGTMLHELVHNVQGPHNAVFYKLLDEITEVHLQYLLVHPSKDEVAGPDICYTSGTG